MIKFLYCPCKKDVNTFEMVKSMSYRSWGIPLRVSVRYIRSLVDLVSGTGDHFAYHLFEKSPKTHRRDLLLALLIKVEIPSNRKM